MPKVKSVRVTFASVALSVLKFVVTLVWIALGVFVAPSLCRLFLSVLARVLLV